MDSASSEDPGGRDFRFGALPPLHVVTNAEILTAPGFTARARDVLAAGGARVALHIRGRGVTGRTIWDLATTLAPEAERRAAALVVNDRVDVVRAAGIATAHLGARSLPPAAARRVLGAASRIGVSVHAAREAGEAAASGANYLFVGTLYPTASHPDREAIGWAGFRRIAAGAPGVPAYGIGGVTAERIPGAGRAGAAGVAAIRGIWSTADPAEAVVRYLEVLDEELRPATEGR